MLRGVKLGYRETQMNKPGGPCGSNRTEWAALSRAAQPVVFVTAALAD